MSENGNPDGSSVQFSEAELFDSIKMLSPKRNTTVATNVDALVEEQLLHFGIAAETEFGEVLADISRRIYACQGDLESMWRLTQQSISTLPQEDKVAYFNAKKFLCFQLAKLLDNLQNPFRRTYQSLGYSDATMRAKGNYPIFDNVTAVFSATPVITRTATYIYACAEWIEDAFKGRELLLEIYSRLLNPTSLALANHIVDMEAGRWAGDYLAWNYNSGMAAIDGVLSHVLGHNDILITSRNMYGGSHQLIFDWYAKPCNMNIGVESFDGQSAGDFLRCWTRTHEKYKERLAKPHIDAFLYLESPSNPHGYVLDVPAICKAAHQVGIRVILDATVGTPFLVQPLQRDDPEERPDFLIHSYTKDLSGSGTVIAGCVIARNEDMFIPKGEPGWDNTMFWNVYYTKGAFLNADAAFEVLQGLKTLESRMLSKCINTMVLAQFFARHPKIKVNSSCLSESTNYTLAQSQLFLGLPAPLFTIEMIDVPLESFQRFFDNLEPTFAHMISLGQTNTIVSCPGLTTHSELGEDQLSKAGISPTTMRFAVGMENPMDLLKHLVSAARLAIDPALSGFSAAWPNEEETKMLVEQIYVETHQQYVKTLLD